MTMGLGENSNKMDQDIVLVLLQEIRDDQKQMVNKLNDLTTQMEISRNGYTPHEVVEMLHWVAEQKEKNEKQSENIRKAIISWIVPILLSAVAVGIFSLYH